MPTGKNNYCWDSCVFISLITGGGRSTEEMRNLLAFAHLVDEGKVTVFYSPITIVEVLASKLTEGQRKQFADVRSRPNVTPVWLDTKVADVAHKIRDHYHKNGLKLKTPDSIHLATAIFFEATALHTFDGAGVKSKRTDLLRLGSPIADEFELTICKPLPPVVHKVKVETVKAGDWTLGFETEDAIDTDLPSGEDLKIEKVE